MRCLIVDDDPLSRAVLERYVIQHELLTLAASCPGPVEAANVLARERSTDRPLDLAFLDVEMPEVTGLDLARSLGGDTQVVIVSGKEEYAAAAFDLAVADYLIKPVDYARFVKAVERATRLRNADGAEVASLPDGPVFVRSEGRLVRVDLREVLYVEAKKDYVVFHAPEREVVVHATMKATAERLPPDAFVRIHRSTIARVDRIEDASEAWVVVGSTRLPVGATYRQALLSRLQTL